MAKGDVEFAKVSYAFAGGRVLLREVSLKLAGGTTTALLGRSGAGKTTLLRMVNGLVRPTSGCVLVDGVDVGSVDVVELRRGIGYVIQETGLFPHMTVERNIGLSLELTGRSRSEITARVTEWLSLVGLDAAEFRERYPWQLSGGQRQRVGLARALASEPKALLMDEPFGALDPLTCAEMQAMLKNLLNRVGKTVVLVTHDLNEALYLADRVVFLDQGEVVADLGADKVSGSENAYVRDYVSAVHRAVSA